METLDNKVELPNLIKLIHNENKITSVINVKNLKKSLKKSGYKKIELTDHFFSSLPAVVPILSIFQSENQIGNLYLSYADRELLMKLGNGYGSALIDQAGKILSHDLFIHWILHLFQIYHC